MTQYVNMNVTFILRVQFLRILFPYFALHMPSSQVSIVLDEYLMTQDYQARPGTRHLGARPGEAYAGNQIYSRLVIMPKT